MADAKTDAPSTPLSDDLDNPTNGGLSAKPNTASLPAGAEPGLDTLFHRTSLRFCCAAKVVTASEAREPDVYCDCSNRLLGGATGGRVSAVQPTHVRTIHPSPGEPPEEGHPTSSQLYLNSLSNKGSTSHNSTYDRLVSVHRILDHERTPGSDCGQHPRVGR